MQIFKYVWRNITRNKIRSSLTILSIAFSLALMTLLHGYMAMQEAWGKEAVKHHRLVVMSSQGLAGALPIAYVDKVRSTDGVKAAVPYGWFGGSYGEERMPFAQFGTDPIEVFNVWDEFRIAPDELKAFQSNRRGCVVGRSLAEKRKWSLGERIRLKGDFYPFNLDLELVGLIDTDQSNADFLWFNRSYLDEGLRSAGAERAAGNAGTIFAKVGEPKRIAEISKRIDDQHASSENPTRTQTESAFAQSFVEMQGNIQAYILFIGLAVVFSLTLVGATAMAMSMRERTTEIAVLKAIGFPRSRVLWMVLGESCLIAIIGGVMGIGLGCLCLEGVHQLSSQLFPISVRDMVGVWLAFLLLIAVAIGLVSGIVPAVRASQLSVIDGLRRVI